MILTYLIYKKYHYSNSLSPLVVTIYLKNIHKNSLKKTEVKLSESQFLHFVQSSSGTYYSPK